MRYQLPFMFSMLLALVACQQGGSVESADHDAPPSRVDSAEYDPTTSKPFVFGEVRVLRSVILAQDRTLNVYLPEGYSPDSARTYPVIYVLDGSANEDFPHIAGLAQFMNMCDLLPKSIVVGIANVDRKHDFTCPTRNDSDKVWVPNSGGSADFIRFIGEELQPFVDANFKTNGHRTIIGQSLGGLVATEMLFKRPELFDDYILVSPSMWWDNGSLAEEADAWAIEHRNVEKGIYIAMARDDSMMQEQVNKFREALRARAEGQLRWVYVEFPQETHATILHRAVYSAFEWIGKK